MRARLPRPTYAQVTATLALFVALGGTGYAATTIGTSQIANNAITTPKIKNAAVNTAKLRNTAVTGAKIASNAVGTAKIANAAVTTPKIAAGAVTASQLAPATLAALQGQTGPAGPAGPPGAVGPSDTYAVFRESGTVIPAMSPTSVTFMQLPAGSWLVQANLVLTNTAAAAREVTCTIVGGGVTIDTATTSLDVAGGLTQTVALAGTAGPTDLTIAAFLCSTSGSLGGVEFTDGDLIATQVGTLHQLAPRP
jgi:hypothetical protein